MKIAIIYKSMTRNTKQLADAIEQVLPKEQIIYKGEPNTFIEADVYIVGSWTDKGMCDKAIATFLKRLKNKSIAYFGTAGFGGASAYYDALFDRVNTNIDKSNTILGYFFCQGKMPMTIRNRYVAMIKEHPDDQKLQVSLENFDQALSHPDKKDLNDIQNWIKTLI